jgi:ferredoxin-type protein NapF
MAKTVVNSESVDQGRRGLFRKVAAPVVNASAQEPATPRHAPRPPRAVDEALFERLCSGCNDCVEACPQHIIALENNLATINVDFEHCTFCDECTKVCQTGALHESRNNSLELIPRFGDQCNNYVGLHCNDCSLACPTQAITIADNEKPKLTPDLCNGCGQCKPTCYVSAIEMILPS